MKNLTAENAEIAEKYSYFLGFPLRSPRSLRLSVLGALE